MSTHVRSFIYPWNWAWSSVLISPILPQNQKLTVSLLRNDIVSFGFEAIAVI